MSVSADRLAVLMTCHNRRDATVRCLESLTVQRDLPGVDVATFVVDDGSNDGTADAVASRFPDVHVMHGDGSLYWAGGMRRAMAAATEIGFDYYLWLNDDCVLEPTAVSRMLACFRALATDGGRDPIVVGSLRDPVTGACSYGGAVRAPGWHPLRFERIAPADTPLRCDVFNGNLVLISRQVAENVGNLERRLRHRTADYEYALRAKRKGFTAWTAPGYLGECSRNGIEGTSEDPALPLVQRYRKLLGPKEYPITARAVYTARHGGVFWPIFFASVYISLPFKHSAARIRGTVR